MSVTVITMVSINDDQPIALSKYLERTEPLLKCVGAKIVKRYSLDNELIGHSAARTLIIVDYPDYEAIDKVFKSETYAEAIPFRDIAFSEYSVHIIS